MFFYINDININYLVEGEGKDIILLHGWGSNLHIFDNITNELKTAWKVWRIDLPGFGKSNINQPLSVEQVSDILFEFIVQNKIVNPTILGHSYGGRIGIVYASKYNVNKLILVSTPGIKNKLSIKKRLKVFIFKLFKRIGITLNVGSNDYKNSNDINKQMLVKTVNQDLRIFMNKIRCLTLLLYGTKDNVTNMELAKKINKEINSSVLIPLEECGHFPFIDRFNYFMIVLKTFLGDNNAC